MRSTRTCSPVWGVSHLEGCEGILYRWLPTRASSAELRMAQKLTDLSRAISWLSRIAGALDSVTTVLWRRNITLSSIIPICCWLSLHTVPICLYDYMFLCFFPALFKMEAALHLILRIKMENMRLCPLAWVTGETYWCCKIDKSCSFLCLVSPPMRLYRLSIGP